MRPVKRALKVLEQPMEDLPQEQQVSQTKEVFVANLNRKTQIEFICFS